MRFSKPPTTFNEQVALFKSRGMEIVDTERAKRYLSHLNYYRLAAYWLPYEQDHPTHRFKPDTSFNTVLDHYIIDRKLRLLVAPGEAADRESIGQRTSHRIPWQLAKSTIVVRFSLNLNKRNRN
jgi:abortive infection bacteriophage resistance protein